MAVPSGGGMIRTEVEAAEDERRRAMVSGDVALLEQIIEPDAMYVHTNSMCESGSSFIDKVKDGAYRYQDVVQPEMDIRFVGDLAVVTGRTVLAVLLKDGSESNVVSRSVVLWAKRDGRWRLHHYQGTSIPK